MPKRPGPEKLATSVRVSAEAKRLMESLAEKLGISQSAVFELAVRQLAKQEKLE
jgi:predicted transcriptional regulator